jgi:hypothetical protein
VGRVPQQSLTLAQRLVHEADLELLQIPDAAVNHLRRQRRRAGGEVVSFNKRSAQPAGRSVQGDPCAGSATADHENIELLVGQTAQGIDPIEPLRLLTHHSIVARPVAAASAKRGSVGTEPAASCPAFAAQRVVNTVPLSLDDP